MIACDNAFPTKIIFGKGARREIGTRLKEYSGNVLFIYGGGSIKRTGLYEEIAAALDQCTLCLRCLHHCPKFAIQYGSGKTKMHGQYRNPHVKV